MNENIKFKNKKDIYLNKKKTIVLSLYLVYSLVLYSLLPSKKATDFDTWLNLINLLIISNFIINILIIYILNIGLISISSFFVLFTYIFQFGHIFLYWIKYEFTVTRLNYLSVYSVPTIMEATEYAFIAIISVFLGVILASKKNTEEKHNNNVSEKELEIYKKIGLILFFPTLLINLYILYYRFILVRTYGSYLALLQHNVPSFINTLSKFIYVSIYLLMIHYKEKNNNKKLFFFMVVGVVITSISLFTGARSSGINELILLLVIYNYSIKKFSKKDIIKGLLVVFGLMMVLSAIRTNRHTGISLNSIINSISKNENNLLLETLDEFGLSLYTLSAIMNKRPFYNHSYSLIFARELVNTVPFLNKIFIEVVTPVIIKLDIFNLGATFIADIFYYLNSFGIFMFIFLGYYIKKIEDLIITNINEKNYFFVSTFILWIIQILSSIRSSFTLGIKVWLLSFVGLVFLRKIIVTFRKKR